MNMLTMLIICAVFLVIIILIKNYNSNNGTANTLNPKEFIEDPNFKTLFPWDDVKLCFKKKLKSTDFAHHYNCPKCEISSEELIWIEFRSPDSTWKELCGRKGPLSICPKCKIQVEFINEVMN